MIISEDAEELQRGADYYLVRSKLKGTAIASILFGALAVITGAMFISENPVNLILLLVGAFLFIEGTWLISSPSPKGMFVDGIALWILGVWNIVVTIVNISAGAAGGAWVFALGIFQIYWGFKRFGQYRRFSGIYLRKPDKVILKQVEDTVKSLTKAKPSDSTNIIELQMDNKPWKGELSGYVGAFVTVGGDDDIIFARRSEISFTGYEKVVPETGYDKTVPEKERSRGISIQIGGRTLEGHITPEAMERYRAWKKV